MSYLFALAFSFVYCFLEFACAVTGGNAEHLKHGRLPNATFVAFPAIPFYQILFVEVQLLLPLYVLWIFAGICSVRLVHWLMSAFQLRTERRRAFAGDRDLPVA